MNEVQTLEQFEQIHQSIYRSMQQDHAHLQADKAASPVLEELSSTLQAMVDNVDPAKGLAPAEMFRAGLDAMDLADRAKFVIDNYLEGLKRGESPSVLWTRYKKLGLVRAPVEAPEAPESAAYDCLYGKSQLKRWACAAAQIAVNAFKSIPEFVEIKATLSLVGPVPVLSFQLETTGMSIQDLFEILRAPGRFHR